jgi:hypothetical protein
MVDSANQRGYSGDLLSGGLKGIPTDSHFFPIGWHFRRDFG